MILAGTIKELDDRGFDVLRVIARAAVAPAGGTYANPARFICDDGNTYWAKANAQQGLSAELIVGRLAHKVGVGPTARVIQVSRELPDVPEHLCGTVVGIAHVPNTANARDLALFGNPNEIGERSDRSSYARVVTFQTWTGITDNQVLIGLDDGRVHTIDHGAAFSDFPDDLLATSVTYPPVPGIPLDQVKNAMAATESVLSKIEAIDDEELAKCVAQIPPGESWKSDPDYRAEIANWLARRRDKLRSVMREWMTS